MRFLLPAAAVVLLSAQAWAADPALLARFDKTLEEIRRSHFEYTGGTTFVEDARLRHGVYTTFGGYAIDDELGHTRILRQLDSKLWFQGQRHGHSVYGRIRFRYQDFNSGDEFAGTSSGLVYPLGDRYWYRFDWQADRRAEEGEDTTWNWWVQVGRQYVEWVTGLVMSDTLYAVRFGFEASLFTVEGMLAITPDSIVDIDSSRTGFTTDTERHIWAISVEYAGWSGHQPFAYILGQTDENDAVQPGGLRHGYDSTYVSVGSTGQIVTGEWLYRIEGVYQFGRSTSDLLGAFPQTIDDIAAWAGRILLAFNPARLRDTRGLRIELEILIGSGDDDRLSSAQASGGNLSGTEDESFNAFGYVNTGHALAPSLANLLAVRIGATAIPFRENPRLARLRVGIDVFYYAKTDDNAPLSTTTTAGQSYVGIGVDLAATWQVTSDFVIDVRYGIFIPGDAVTGSELHFGYLGISYGF